MSLLVQTWSGARALSCFGSSQALTDVQRSLIVCFEGVYLLIRSPTSGAIPDQVCPRLEMLGVWTDRSLARTEKRGEGRGSGRGGRGGARRLHSHISADIAQSASLYGPSGSSLFGYQSAVRLFCAIEIGATTPLARPGLLIDLRFQNLAPSCPSSCRLHWGAPQESVVAMVRMGMLVFELALSVARAFSVDIEPQPSVPALAILREHSRSGLNRFESNRGG